MKPAFIYSLKVWITTIILGMRITGLIRISLDTDHLIYGVEDIFNSAIYDIPIGFVACLPSWLIFSVTVRYVNAMKTSLIYKKTWLTLISIFLGILPFAFLFWPQLTHTNYWPDMLPEIIGYAVVTTAGIWFYKLEPVTDPSVIVETSPK